jgi:hypothetical protein
MTAAAEIQQRRKGPRPETRATSGEQRDFYEALEQSEQSSFPSGCIKGVTGHNGGISPLQNERGVQSAALGKGVMVVHLDQLAPY